MANNAMVRDWLIEHFGFIPREDYEERYRHLVEVAKYAARLERENTELQQEWSQMENERDNLIYELEKISLDGEQSSVTMTS